MRQNGVALCKTYIPRPSFLVYFRYLCIMKKIIEPVARFRSPFSTKFGIPRQSGIVENLGGRIVFEPPFRSPDAVRGMDGFDYLWLIWGFSENADTRNVTVRPPLLGGNMQMGVFATRSSYRPNGLALSSVRIGRIDMDTPCGPVVHVLGADLMDGTPVYDIKPYLPYADSHAGARGGFTDDNRWHTLRVVIPEELASLFSGAELDILKKVLSLDPRPRYHDDASRVYGMPYAGKDIRFTVCGDVLCVVGIAGLQGV